MYSLKGNETVEYVEKLIDAVRLKEGYGVYESLYNAIWTFPSEVVGQVLAKRLPELQRRMGNTTKFLDFVIELLSMNHGKHWRQINTLTNPLWGYAHKILFEEFVERVKALSSEKQTKLLENIKRVNNRKFKDLKEALFTI